VFSPEEAECPLVQGMLRKGFVLVIDPNRPPLGKSCLESPGESTSSRKRARSANSGDSDDKRARSANSDDSDDSDDESSDEDEAQPLSIRLAELKKGCKRSEPPVTLTAGETTPRRAPHFAALRHCVTLRVPPRVILS